MNEPDRPVDPTPLGPGVNAGPITACAETPVNGRQRLATVLPVSLIFMLVTCFGCGTNAYEKKSADTEAPAAKTDESGGLHWPNVIVSKETTYFTEPLRPDGGVDYVAALNKLLSEGVTPENNALIPLLRATGPKDIDKNIRQKYFEMLGIPELPEEGEYLIGIWELPEYKEAEKQSGEESHIFSDKIWEQNSKAAASPWSKQTYPLWALTLERNNKQLDMIVKGLQRPRFYSPFVLARDESSMIVGCNLLVFTSEVRGIMRLLAPRPMLRLHEGDVSGAWEDIVAMYRLARLQSQRPSYCDWMTGVTAEGMADVAAVAFSRQNELAAEQARECLKQLKTLLKGVPVGDIFNKQERCSTLEIMAMLSHPDGLKSYFELEASHDYWRNKDKRGKISEPEWKRRLKACQKLTSANDVDWTEVYRYFNSFYDRLVETANSPNYVDALNNLESISKQIRNEATEIVESVLSDEGFNADGLDSITRSQYIAKLAIKQKGLYFFPSAITIEQRRKARAEMVALAFALAGYRAEHDGQYPTTLSELPPNYIDAIPNDPFNNRPFHYMPEVGGYQLRSSGSNGDDDLTIRTPQKAD